MTAHQPAADTAHIQRLLRLQAEINDLLAAAQGAGAAAVTLGEAIAQMMAAKQSAGRRPQYLTSVRQYLALFAAGREGLPLACLSTGDIEAWFAERREKPVTRASNLGRLAALFSFGVRRGWILRSPCDAVERVRIERTPPRILTPAECAELLRACWRRQPRLLPVIVLGLFAGMRPTEIAKLDWGAVNFAQRLIRVDAQISKVRMIRWVPVCGRLESWLLLCPERRGPVSPRAVTLRRGHRRLRELLGWERWPQDIIRHTAASYLLATLKDAQRVSLDLGNSPKILLNHYNNLVMPDDARAFWELTPQSVLGADPDATRGELLPPEAPDYREALAA